MIGARLARFSELGGAGFTANAQAWNERFFAGSFGIFHVGQHRFANDFETVRLHPNLIAHFGAGHEYGRLAADRILSHDAFDQPGIKNLPAIGNRGDHHSDLQQRKVDRALANGDVGRVAVGPAFEQVFHPWKRSTHIVRHLKRSPLSEVELFAEPDNSLRTVDNAVGDEVAVAGFHEGMAKIVIAVGIALRIFNGATTDPDHLWTVKWLQWIQTRIEAGEADHNFENGSRRIGHARGAIDLRPEVFVLEFCILLVAHAADIAVRVEAGTRRHRENVSGVWIHDDDGATDWSTIRSGSGAERFFGGFLDCTINREHDVFSRFGRIPNGFRLAVAEAVYEDGLHAGLAAQVLIQGPFN